MTGTSRVEIVDKNISVITGQHIKCKKCGYEIIFNDLTRDLCAWYFIGRTRK